MLSSINVQVFNYFQKFLQRNILFVITKPFCVIGDCAGLSSQRCLPRTTGPSMSIYPRFIYCLSQFNQYLIQTFLNWVNFVKNRSMATANFNKSVWLVANTTAASKYIPRRPRISINWNPPFQTSLHKISKEFL